MSLLNRIEKHMTTCAIAAVGAAAVASAANAAIVYTSFNHVIPANTDGTYLNIETGAFVDGPGSGVPGWDVNPWSGTTLNFFNPSGIPGTNAYVTLGTGVASLAAGTSISGSSTYTSGAYTSTGAGAWTLNAANIVGFRFVNAASQVRYGWMRIQVGATVTTRSFVDYAYEDTGAAINAGAVPGPAGLAALALGAMGIRGRRRK
ncbi:MAG: hypothetical protein U0625_07275 [Phycisphaerales bacterium]